jgi:hypothetical protein
MQVFIINREQEGNGTIKRAFGRLADAVAYFKELKTEENVNGWAFFKYSLDESPHLLNRFNHEIHTEIGGLIFRHEISGQMKKFFLTAVPVA